jgi:predicted transcriptional regulator
METRDIKTIEDEVNRKNSRLWLQMNDNSKANLFRQKFVNENGGFFKKEGRFWVWVSQREVNNGYWLKRVDTDEKVFFESMKEFGEKHGLSPVKICELLNGKRKTYKGWTAVELRAVKETVGSHEKEKKEVKKVKIYTGATFQNIQTKEIIHVENVAEFARINNINKGNLYKVATGKMKSYKGLKLYNPLDC